MSETKNKVEVIVSKPQFNVDKIKLGTFCKFKDSRYDYSFTNGLISEVTPFQIDINYIDDQGSNKRYEVPLELVIKGTFTLNLIED